MPPIPSIALSSGLDWLNPALPEARLLPALFVTVVFGILGYLSRGVTRSGAVAGTAVSFLIYVSLGLGGFVTLFGVFAITWLTTRVGYARKRQIGVAEDRHGRRAGQVLANIAAAGGFAVLSRWLGPIAVFAAIASLAEAAADTTSSEIGEIASQHAWLITTFSKVPAGTDGAISAAGTLSGITASVLISLLAVEVHLLPLSLFWIPSLAGILGTLIDSVLGATLERRHRLNNNAVNFLSTLSSGLIAMALFHH